MIFLGGSHDLESPGAWIRERNPAVPASLAQRDETPVYSQLCWKIPEDFWAHKWHYLQITAPTDSFFWGRGERGI